MGEEQTKRWAAKRKANLVKGIIQGNTNVSEASRAYDLSPSDIEGWIDKAMRGMETPAAVFKLVA